MRVFLPAPTSCAPSRAGRFFVPHGYLRHYYDIELKGKVAQV